MEQTTVETIPKPRRGTRITPRTCLWPLAGSLVVTFGLSIGLTFRSNHHCYAGTCGAWLFPLQTRLHVIIWYMWLSISVTFLAVRAFHPEMQKVLTRPIWRRKLPLVGRSLTIGGSLIFLWIIALYAVVIGVWWIRLRDYFVQRSIAGGIHRGGNRLAAVALTGHLCDITMGMVLVPISRHSALASFFKLSVSTTLTNHMLTAYTLFTLVLIHAFLYVAWVPVFNSLSNNSRMIIPVLNPTYLYNEVWPGNQDSLGIWRASLIFTGITAVIIMAALSVTTLPRVRSKHFNLFYFTHLFSIVMVIIICLHASTILYCTAPGLAMWFLDWGMRIYELRKVLDGDITTIGNGWYWYAYLDACYVNRILTTCSVTTPLPRARLTGCSCRSPLAHFYIHHAGSSIRELHPFTTITHLASKHSETPLMDDDFPIQFLFRKRTRPDQPASDVPNLGRLGALRRLLRGKKSRAHSAQWTDKLAGLVDKQQEHDLSFSKTDDSHSTPGKQSFPKINIALRLEGPYFSPADPSRYHKVVCLVAGTGISGAIAIAGAFVVSQRSRLETTSEKPIMPTRSPWQKCSIIWSVKSTDFVELPFIEKCEGLEMQTYLTGPGRARVDVDQVLGDVREAEPKGRTWVYISGPNPFIEAGKRACKAAGDVEFYAPSWEI